MFENSIYIDVIVTETEFFRCYYRTNFSGVFPAVLRRNGPRDRFFAKLFKYVDSDNAHKHKILSVFFSCFIIFLMSCLWYFTGL